MEDFQVQAVLEGLLFASGDDGMTVNQLSQILELTKSDVIHHLEELIRYYEDESRGLRITEYTNTYFFATKQEHSKFHEKRVESPAISKLSQASLETLAMIAYQQPITRTEIEEIRGVKSDRPIQTLIARELIEEAGRKETIGRPVLFRTTKEFLLSFGLSSLKELPELANISDSEVVESDLFLKGITKLPEEI